MKLTDVEKRVLDCIKTGVTFSGVAPEPYQICFRLKLPGSLLRPVLRAMELKGCIERDLNGKSTIQYLSMQPVDTDLMRRREIDGLLRVIYIRTEFIKTVIENKLCLLAWKSTDQALSKFIINQYTKQIEILESQNEKLRRKVAALIEQHAESDHVKLLG